MSSPRQILGTGEGRGLGFILRCGRRRRRKCGWRKEGSRARTVVCTPRPLGERKETLVPAVIRLPPGAIPAHLESAPGLPRVPGVWGVAQLASRPPGLSSTSSVHTRSSPRASLCPLPPRRWEGLGLPRGEGACPRLQRVRGGPVATPLCPLRPDGGVLALPPSERAPFQHRGARTAPRLRPRGRASGPVIGWGGFRDPASQPRAGFGEARGARGEESHGLTSPGTRRPTARLAVPEHRPPARVGALAPPPGLPRPSFRIAGRLEVGPVPPVPHVALGWGWESREANLGEVSPSPPPSPRGWAAAASGKGRG